MSQTQLSACVFGASPGTGNQGVNALCFSTLEAMAQRGCNDLHVFDYGQATRPARFGELQYTLHGISVGKRLWRSNHLGTARLAVMAGFHAHSVVRTVANADLVLDVSGGDSFTDLYGGARFRNIVAPKQIALRVGKPLVLLPQTFGPFTSDANRRIAGDLIAGASLAYARDPDSYARLQDLLGDRFDPSVHRQGVDLAFGLRARKCAHLEPNVMEALTAKGKRPIIGLNISGLVANQPTAAATRFGLTCDYPALIRQLMMRLLDETDAQLIIVPHVHAPTGHYESDLDASRALVQSLTGRHAAAAKDRITIVNQELDACELKWLIAKCDWFCGTRMHATIAALSSGVPTVALAYSLKTRGVFDTCAMASSSIDMRSEVNASALDQVMSLWQQREYCAATLNQRLENVRTRGSLQMDEIAGCNIQGQTVGRMLEC
ncbi:MAG: polysaccharide pyruvyl transferase family protein [Halioglobus sp.]